MLPTRVLADLISPSPMARAPLYRAALLSEVQPLLSRDSRGGIGIRTSDSAGGERLDLDDDGFPPPNEPDDLLAVALTRSNTFRTIF